MLILAAYKSVIVTIPAITALVGQRIYLQRVDQNAGVPHVLLELLEEGQDYTHSGPTGLFDAHVRITARAATDAAAFTAADAIARALQNWTGEAGGCRVQMTEHFNSYGGFDKDNGLFTQALEFTSFYTRLS